MEKFKISEVCNISNGFAFKSEKYVNDNGARVIRITNVQKGKIVDNDPKLYPFSELDKLEAYKIFEGDILMSLTGNVGRVGRFPKELLPAYINQRVCRVMPKNEKLDTNFLFHFLNSDVFENEAIKNSAGAAQLNLSTKWLGDFEIPLPNLATQQRIATILDQAEAIIQNNRAIVQKYDALTQSLFLDMFGDPVKNEKGWKKKEINDLINPERPITYGILMPKEDVKPFGIPYIKVIDVKDGLILHEKVCHTTESIESKYIRSRLRENDLLISIRGHVGRICLVPPKYINANITQDSARLDFKNEIEPLFAEFCLGSLEFQRYMSKYVKGAGVKGINLGDLKKLLLIVPDISIQKRYAKAVLSIKIQKQQAQLELAKSEELFASLLQRAFKGDLN